MTVIYIIVLNTQYYFWIPSLLPLCLYNFKAMNRDEDILFWDIGLVAYFAFLLEFQGKCMFLYLFFTSGLFFLINTIKVDTLVQHYSPKHIQSNPAPRVTDYKRAAQS